MLLSHSFGEVRYDLLKESRGDHLLCCVQVTSHLQSLGKKKSEELLKCLREAHFIMAMENITSPLDPMLHCKTLT